MRNTRPLWLAIIIIASMLVAAAGGTLSWLAEGSVPAALLTSGAVFGATVLLLLAVAYFLEGTRPN